MYELATHDPGPEQQRLIGELRAIFKQKTFDKWIEFLTDVEVSWAPVLNMAEAFDHPHARARQMLFEDSDGTELPGTPVKFRNEPGQVKTRAPRLNEFAGDVASTGWNYDDWE